MTMTSKRYIGTAKFVSYSAERLYKDYNAWIKRCNDIYSTQDFRIENTILIKEQSDEDHSLHGADYLIITFSYLTDQ